MIITLGDAHINCVYGCTLNPLALLRVKNDMVTLMNVTNCIGVRA